jgi:diaminopimelate decarboxylase
LIETDQTHRMTLDGPRLVKLAQQYGTPQYIYDADRLAANAACMQAAVPATFHYFEFANRNHAILQKIRQQGFGITISRPAGVERALQLGFMPEQIQCSGFGFDDENLRFFLAHGVQVNLASLAELRRASELFPDTGFGVRLDLKSDPWEKRGISSEDLIDFVRERRLHIMGLHTYLGTNVLKPSEHSMALAGLLAVLQKLPAQTRSQVRYINVGGGFGYDYANRCTFDWGTYGQFIQSIIQSVQFALGQPWELKLEVGRALVVNCGYLLARVLHIYQKAGRWFVVVDSNASHFGRPARYGFHKAFYPYLEDGVHRSVWLDPDGTTATGSRWVEAAVVGNSHYSKDWFGLTQLPEAALERYTGSYLVILDVGAYGESMSDQWADEPRPAAVLVEGETCTLVTRREQPSELYNPPRERW